MELARANTQSEAKVNNETNGQQLNRSSSYRRKFGKYFPSFREVKLTAEIKMGDWAEEGAASALLADIDTKLEVRTDGTSLSGESQELCRKEDITVEIEALVRRVVPDEIRECFALSGFLSSIPPFTHVFLHQTLDNIEAMMFHFEGREEVLIETLEFMEERIITQK